MEHAINDLEDDVKALKKELRGIDEKFQMQESLIRFLMLALSSQEATSLARFEDLYTKHLRALPDTDFREKLREYNDWMFEFAQQFLPPDDDA